MKFIPAILLVAALGLAFAIGPERIITDAARKGAVPQRGTAGVVIIEWHYEGENRSEGR